MEEFIAAFKPSGVSYPYDLEDAIMQVADVVDVVVVLMDAKRTRINVREVNIYKQLHERHKFKTHMALYLDEKLASAHNLQVLLYGARDF